MKVPDWLLAKRKQKKGQLENSRRIPIHNVTNDTVASSNQHENRLIIS